MPLNPRSEPPGRGEPDDYARDHPEEDARQWGWHAEWGAGARVAGWIVAAILLLLATSTNYQFEYHLILYLLAGFAVLVLLRDRARRNHDWRR